MSSFKLLTTSEVKKHSRTGDLWLVIHDDVYDVSQFMEDHPGGADALLSQGGIDATSAFEDVGHSGDARAIMDRFRIGKAEKMPKDARLSSGEYMHLEQQDSGWRLQKAALALLVLCTIAYTLIL